MSALKTILEFSDQHNLGWSRETAVQILVDWARLVGTTHLAAYAGARAADEASLGAPQEADREGTPPEADEPMPLGDYLAHRGLRCPYCKGRDLGPERPRTDDLTGEEVWIRVECEDCGRAWDEIYALVGVRAQKMNLDERIKG